MIVTGHPWWHDFIKISLKTEIIDVINGETCSDIADFKMVFSGVGANLQGIPVLCGRKQNPSPDSIYYSFNCFKFTKNGGWQEFTSMDGQRESAAGIVYNNKFHVFGGWVRNLCISRVTQQLLSRESHDFCSSTLRNQSNCKIIN